MKVLSPAKPEAAREDSNVLGDPAATVIFDTFGDHSLSLLLRCFIDSVDQRVSTISAFNEAINEKFNAVSISIAFLRHDLHLRSIKPLRVQIEHASPVDHCAKIRWPLADRNAPTTGSAGPGLRESTERRLPS